MELADPTLLQKLLIRHSLTLDQLRARGRSESSVPARRAALVRELWGEGRTVGEVCSITGLTPTGVRRLLQGRAPPGWSREVYRAAVFGRVTAGPGFEDPEEVPLELPYVVVRGRRRGGGYGYVVAAPELVLSEAAVSLGAFRVLVGEDPVRAFTGRELGLEP